LQLIVQQEQNFFSETSNLSAAIEYPQKWRSCSPQRT